MLDLERSIPRPTVTLLLALCLAAPAAHAGGLGGDWMPEGPAPNTDGQVENIVPDDEVTGAVNAVVTHPTDPDVVYLGLVNGGVWRTDDATAASPDWTPLTDDFGSLSIAALDLDPTDVTGQTVVAGIGRFSSYGRRGGDRIGLLRTTDGGASWVLLDGGGTLTGKNASGVAARGAVLVVSVNQADVDDNTNRGVFRSDDGGVTFTRVSVGTGTGTGLPEGRSFDVGRDPSDDDRLYTVIVNPTGTDSIYRSDDAGANWTQVGNATIDGLLGGNVSNVEFAVNPNGVAYVVIATSGSTSGVFRSTNQGATWTQMDTPSTHPGGQASVHLSLVADPSNDNLVYIGGDRQNIGDFGAQDFSGRLFRGDASLGAGSQWVHLTHSTTVGPPGGGTASSSAPHADSREMAFDAAGILIEVDDGGVYKRTSPEDNTGDWFSINGDLQSTELHSMAYDANAEVIISGAQDTGTPMQETPGGPRWFSISTADGGDVVVDDSTTPGMSVRYSSFQFLSNFRRTVWDSNNNLLATSFPPLTPVGGSPGISGQFTTPVGINEDSPVRLIIGGSNGVYESLNEGATVQRLSPVIAINQTGADAIAYGVPGDADILWVGSSNRVFVRTGAPPALLVESATYPGGTVVGITLDSDDGDSGFVTDGSSVFWSVNAGATWTDVTGNLGGFGAGVIGAVEYLATVHGDAIAVGTNRGIYVALEGDGFASWQILGSGAPNARVWELDYDPATDLLVAGFLGRGAWSLAPTLVPANFIFADGFESGDTTAWSSMTP